MSDKYDDIKAWSAKKAFLLYSCPPATDGDRLFVPATAYYPPNGRKQAGGMYASPDKAILARELIEKHGVKFELELLRTQEVSLTAEYADDSCAPLVLEIAPNNEAIFEVFDEVITKAYERATSHD